MTTQTDSTTQTPTLDEQEIAAYLRAHPEFVLRHPDVLTALEVPHRPGGGAVSLIERQVAELRRRNERLEHRLEDLMRTARANERVGARLLALGRGLLESESLDGALALVRESLLSEFTADDATVLLIPPESATVTEIPPAHRLAGEDDRLDSFTELLDSGEPVCGRLPADQLEALFGERSSVVASAAVIPFRAGAVTGMIAMASEDPERFAPSMGTLFLGQLGELVAAGVGRYIG